MDYVGKIPEVSYHGMNHMSEINRNEFHAWYEGQKFEVFDNRPVLELYCQCDISVFAGSMSAVEAGIHSGREH